MRTIIGVFRERVLATFWFLPSLLIAIAIGLAFGLVRIDEAVGEVDQQFVFSGSPDSAREVVTTVASSLLTIIGVTVPLTIVALQLASTQFTQRILRRFMRDRLVQAVLGVFIGVFAYSLLVLRVIRSSEDLDESFVPQIAVTADVVLALLSLALFVVFVNHIVNLIQVSNIVRSVGADARAAIEARLLAAGGQEAASQRELPTPPPGAQAVAPGATGYLQAVDDVALLRYAIEHDVSLWLTRRLGQFCAGDAPLFFVAGGDPSHRHRLGRFVSIGADQTISGNPLFGFRQLVDIAVRALSPGVNDPTTAVQCLDYLGALLLLVVARDTPWPARTDRSGNIRLVLREPGLAEYVAEAFDEIRVFAEGNTAVTRRLIEVAGEVMTAARGRDSREVLAKQVEMILRGIERSVSEPRDANALRELGLHVLRARSARRSGLA